jgi:cell division protein FtsN
MLVAGIMIGSLGTILWQGTQVADGGVGTGIRKMIEQSRVSDQDSQAAGSVSEADKPVKQETTFDFFTVLPEIEVVVPDVEPEQVAGNTQNSAQDNTGAEKNEQAAGSNASAYMLQAGSYQRKADADKLKAELALIGHSSTIQKVTIEGRGDFFRVRLGPYTTHDQMVEVDATLSDQGIKALRLKISRGG